MKENREKTPLTARQKARRGMIIGPIVALICYLFIFVMLIGFGEGSAGDMAEVIPSALLFIVISPIYGLGFAFNWRRTLDKTCRRLGISAEVGFFSIIVYCFTKNKNHLIFGFMIAVFIPCWTLGMGWLPGIFYGIRELREEHRAEMEAGRSSGKYVEPKTLKWLFGNPNPDEEDFADMDEEDLADTDDRRWQEAVTERPAERRTANRAAGAVGSVSRESQRTLRCLTGTFAGATIPVKTGQELVLGRDPASCNLVMEGGDISRVHCRISYDSAAGAWKVMDQSTNGTYIGSRKLAKGKYETIPIGATLTLGRGGEKFQL